MTGTYRLNEIKRTVESMSTSIPDIDVLEDKDAFWMGFRDSPDAYRLVVDGEPRYDVWAEIDASYDRAGILEITLEVVLYDVLLYAEFDRHTVLSTGLDGHHQPTEQAFLNNAHHYEQQLQDKIDNFARTAEYWVLEE